MFRPNWCSRPFAIGTTLVTTLILLILAFHDPTKERVLSFSGLLEDDEDSTNVVTPDQRFHLLLPASEGNVDLCKTFLTGAILGYPTPTLIAWNETFDRGNLLGGGSHVAKISKVLEYLENMDASQDNDLMMMMDAYDIWFQLPAEVLISRYHGINKKANKRLRRRLGSTAVKAESLQQTIIFGAGKRCAPNQMHTIGCYPIPASPLPDDLYGSNTDTVMGRNKYSSHKQRYLNSGYIIGPVSDMRRLFARAWSKVEALHSDQDLWDNGSHGSDFMYHGSDQSIFAEILGEQEYQREVMRRRHQLRSPLSRTPPTYLEGTVISDILNPPFTHQPGTPKPGKPDEFGIGLDYFSELGHQTVNTEEDIHYLTFSKSIDEQLKERKGLFDCPSRVTGSLPEDVLNSNAYPDREEEERQEYAWHDRSLLTNVCLNTVPVMIHHNGDKGARGWQWPMTWMQSEARELFGEARNRTTSTTTTGGANLPSGETLSWNDLCGANKEWEWELFRDIEKPPQ